jgi:hypothetical protein
MAEFIVVLGVAAAAGQLVDQGLKIIALSKELRSIIKEDFASIQSQLAGVQQLINIASEIRDHTLNEEYLHVPVIACLESAARLHHALKDYHVKVKDSSYRRVMKALRWKQDQKKIAETAAALDDLKSTLILAIVHKTSQQVSEIGSSTSSAILEGGAEV